ncbi:MAG: hypothetical protein WDO13_21865 [Verrucomicrobiota bacterium]
MTAPARPLTGNTTVDSGSTIQLKGSNQVATGATVTINGSGAAGTTGALENVSGSNALASGIALGSAATIASDDGSTLTLTGGITTNGNYGHRHRRGAIRSSAPLASAARAALSKSGTGALTLNTSNAYSRPDQRHRRHAAPGNGNSTSATGTTSLTVGSGGTIGGFSATPVTTPTIVGTSITSTFSISGKVIVGTGTDAVSGLKIAANSTAPGFNGNLQQRHAQLQPRLRQHQREPARPRQHEHRVRLDQPRPQCPRQPDHHARARLHPDHGYGRLPHARQRPDAFREQPGPGGDHLRPGLRQQHAVWPVHGRLRHGILCRLLPLRAGRQHRGGSRSRAVHVGLMLGGLGLLLFWQRRSRTL